MDEKYISLLYDFMSSQSKEFSKNISIEYFAEKVSSDEKYVSLLYDFMSDNSGEFSKNFTLDKFQSKLGFTEVGDIKLTNNLTTPSSDEIKKQYDNGEITHQEYLMLKSDRKSVV